MQWRDYDPTTGRYTQSDPIGLRGGISTYGYVGGNPYTRIDPQGLDDSAAMFNPGFWGRPQTAAPDYYHASVSYLIGSISLTLTRSGRLYIGAGPVYGGAKSTVDTRIRSVGLSLTSGILTGCNHESTAVDNFVDGQGTGVSAFYGVGGGVVLTNSGTAVETGFGTPGATFQPFEANKKIADTIFRW
jgi:hypothetical protein